MKEFFKGQVGVPYPTASRYMAFSLFVSKYPRLLICDLTFSQIMHHHRGLLKYIATDLEFASNLGLYVSLSAQNCLIDINPANVNIPNVMFKINANTVFNESAEAETTTTYEECEWDNPYLSTNLDVSETSEVDDILNDLTLDQ